MRGPVSLLDADIGCPGGKEGGIYIRVGKGFDGIFDVPFMKNALVSREELNRDVEHTSQILLYRYLRVMYDPLFR